MTQDTTTRTTVDPPPLLPITLAAPKRILVLRAGAFGDIIFALPSLALLKEAWPEAEVHWLAKTPFVPFIGSASLKQLVELFGVRLKLSIVQPFAAA